MSIDIHRQIECVKREITFRKRCYPRWVEQDRMTREVADRELSTMEAVLATLQRIATPELGL